MKLSVEVQNPNTKQSADLHFPATHSAITDTIMRLQSDENVNIRGRMRDEFGRYTREIYFENCNIFEFNHLSKLVEHYDYYDMARVFGALEIFGCNTVGEIINIAMNIKENEIIDIQPVDNPSGLAEFYLQNDLIPELKDITDEQYMWIAKHVDYQALGEEIVLAEKGVFIGDAYITAGKLEELYDGIFPPLAKEEYVFKVEIGLRHENEDSKRVELSLPTEGLALNDLLRDFQVSDFSQLCAYKMQSVIPFLEPMDFDMTEIETMNGLAMSIQHFQESGEFATYKAMVDALDVIGLESVVTLCDFVGEFTLQSDARSYADYGRAQFKDSLTAELLECLDTDEYGRRLAQKNATSLTSYGMLVPNDAVHLFEKMQQPKTSHDFGSAMEMKMY